MTNADIKKFATALHQVLSDIEDKKLEAKSILEAAKEQGLNTKALAKVAKEMLKDSDKLRRQYADEEQLDLFRAEAGLFKMKGLDDTEKASAAFRMAGDRRLQKSASELDALIGTDLAKTHKDGIAAVRRMQARTHAKHSDSETETTDRSKAMSGDAA